MTLINKAEVYDFSSSEEICKKIRTMIKTKDSDVERICDVVRDGPTLEQLTFMFFLIKSQISKSTIDQIAQTLRSPRWVRKFFPASAED